MQKALINDGRIIEIFDLVDAEGIPLSDRYHPEFIEQLVDYDPKNPPPEPAPANPSAVQHVTRAQAKLALLDAGLLDDVEQAIAGMIGDDARRASIEWNERETFERQSPFLLQMAGLIGLDDAALDALFADAAGR